MSLTAFPLCWPKGFNRTTKQDKGAFRTTLNGAIKNVQESLQAFARDSKAALEDLVISSNVSLGQNRPKDAGVAVWFVWGGMQVCVPVDRYTTVEANLQAIHHIIEARRVELRHGTLQLVRATFAGFAALPPPDPRPSTNSTITTVRPWWVVLGVSKNCSTSDARESWRRLVGLYHPDGKQPDVEKFHEVQAAWRQVSAEHGVQA